MHRLVVRSRIVPFATALPPLTACLTSHIWRVQLTTAHLMAYDDLMCVLNGVYALYKCNAQG